MNAIKEGFVATDSGLILVQKADNGRWGFSLHDDDQCWPGGFGIAREWTLLAPDDPRITPADHERLDWILDLTFDTDDED